MPARPAYFHRITEALEVLRKLESDWIDRRTLEETTADRCCRGLGAGRRWRLLGTCWRGRDKIAGQECAGVTAGWEPYDGLGEFGLRHASVSSTSLLYSQAATPPGSKS